MGTRQITPLALALALALVGCDETTSGGPSTAVPAASVPTSPIGPVSIDPLPVDRAAREALPDDARAAIRLAPLPVLVVNRPGLLAASKLMVHRHWVALASQHDGVSVSISGKRIKHRYPHLPSATGNVRVRGLPAFVTANEQIWSASWQQYGVTYTIDVECNTLPDLRCDDGRFVVELSESLVHVGSAETTP